VFVLKYIEDVDKNRELIERCIKRHAFSPEHTFAYLKYYKAEGGKSNFASFEDDMGAFLIDYEDEIWMINEPLAPKDKQADIVLEILDHVFSYEDVTKITVEFQNDLRKEVIKRLKEKNIYYARRTTDLLTWPIFNMKTWDASLSGKHWKKIRNYLNKFKRDYKIEIKEASEVPKEELLELLKTWVKCRTPKDRAFDELFINYINDGFSAFEMTRVILLNNKPVALSGGWKIPNSKNYYSSVGIYDYSIDRIGEFANIDDLQELKKRGFDYVDFGGGGDSLTNFKKKFLPESFYQTHIFAIARIKDKKSKKTDEKN